MLRMFENAEVENGLVVGTKLVQNLEDGLTLRSLKRLCVLTNQAWV